jgi:hypothetical protein
MANPYFALQAEPAQLAPVRLRWPRSGGSRPSMAPCLTLALLSHLLRVLVFGNPPGSSARPGQGVWGALNVRLGGGDLTGQPESSLAAGA